MRYISTRGEAPALSFDDVLLTGLAADGGLYLPEHWPALGAAERDDMRGLSYAELATRVMTPYLGGRIADDDFAAMVAETYAGFDHAEVAPMVPLGPDEFLVELFHGPTLAFKDYALQLVGRLFDYVLARRGERITIVGATSGDTGSAAIEACRDREAIEVFILHPEGRVSEVQRRQMTTVQAANIHNIAIIGTFDDCQDIVKALFADRALRAEISMSAVNSINWARIMAQIVYYVWAALRPEVAGRPPVFAVPTGNFGNVFAGYAAVQMGLPVERLVIGSNVNDILTRFFEHGRMEIKDVHPTLSPSMDIQVSSNFERLLHALHGRDGAAVARSIATFRETGVMEVTAEQWRAAKDIFAGYRLDDDGTKRVIAHVYDETGMLVDPHTAVGIAAGRAYAAGDAPVIALATAHPAKFPDAVEAATGVRPELPEHLADLSARTERFEVVANDVGAVRAYIRDNSELAGAA